LVNFWATWCPPCLEEMPSLDYLYRRLKAKNDPKLPILITISVDKDPKDVLAVFTSFDFSTSFVVLYDKEGVFTQSVGTEKFPETYWIKPTGEIIYKWIGPQNWLSEEVIHVLMGPH